MTDRTTTPTTTTNTHGASCTCPPCMERSDRAFTVWYDAQDADPAAAVVAQAFTSTSTSTAALTSSDEPPAYQHQPPTCGRCLARMRYPRAAQGEGWTWGAFGWKHDCGWHR